MFYILVISDCITILLKVSADDKKGKKKRKINKRKKEEKKYPPPQKKKKPTRQINKKTNTTLKHNDNKNMQTLPSMRRVILFFFSYSFSEGQGLIKFTEHWTTKQNVKYLQPIIKYTRMFGPITIKTGSLT